MICKRFEVTEDNEIKDYGKTLTINEVVNKMNKQNEKIELLSSIISAYEETLEDEYCKKVELQKYIVLKGLKDEYLKWQTFKELKKEGLI